MQRWEYCMISAKGSPFARGVDVYYCTLAGASKLKAQAKGDYVDKLARSLAELGEEGWEMVGCVGISEDISEIYLKRPKGA